MGAEASAKGSDIHETFQQKMQTEIRTLLDGYREMLQNEYPGCNVEFASGSQYEDFTRIARHRGPVFCGPSSYCLWAGLANMHGPVYFHGVALKPQTIRGGRGKDFIV